VSNFCKEIVIPLSQVQHVQKVKQFEQKLIVLTLNRPTEFGRTIMFLPLTQLRLWKEHSVVGELKRLKGAGRNNRCTAWQKNYQYCQGCFQFTGGDSINF
jgi:hypothetical protein